MRRIPREPMRYEVADLLAWFGREQRISLRSRDVAERFVGRVRDPAQSALANPALLHGRRTQAMFEALVVSLGTVDLVKQEDAGEVYGPDEALKVPDFKLVLTDSTQLVVEVKNHHPNDPSADFAMRAADLDSLQRYAHLIANELRIAIYWSGSNTWTLVPPSAFRLEGNKRTVDFRTAVIANELSVLGDALVGARFPLRMRIVPDRGEPREVGADGETAFTVGDLELYCAGRLLTDAVDRDLAWRLMLFGEWVDEEGPNEAEIADGMLEAITLGVVPPEDHGQGFEIIGSLSGMFSRYYGWMTLPGREVEQVRAEPASNVFGRFIPDGYTSDALPLWFFRQEVSSSAHQWNGHDGAERRSASSAAATESERERLERLERAGDIKLGPGGVPDEFWSLPHPADPRGSAVRAVIEEREAGW